MILLIPLRKTDFDNKLKQNVIVENELKKDRHLTQVFLSVKSTFLMMEHNFT